MDIYREAILDHYKNPRNFGHLTKPTVKVEEDNVTCGDRVVMELKVDGKVVTDVAFSGVGCAISQASASMLTEKVKGMKLKDALKLTGSDMIELLGTQLTPSRMKCATLSLEVLHKGILSLKSK